MRINCRDCGEELPPTLKVSKRDDVCDGCYESRRWLVSAEGMAAAGSRIPDIQRAMANGRGTAKRLIEAVRKAVQS